VWKHSYSLSVPARGGNLYRTAVNLIRRQRDQGIAEMLISHRMRYLFAIGGNEQAAAMTGVPVRLTKVVVCMLSSLSAGIAGIVQTGWLGAVTTNIGAGLELQVIAAAVIGGGEPGGRGGYRDGCHHRRDADRGEPQLSRPFGGRTHSGRAR